MIWGFWAAVVLLHIVGFVVLWAVAMRSPECRCGRTDCGGGCLPPRRR